MKNHTLEVCVDSVASALAASRGGADRLELCADLVIGGTTPGIPLFREIRKYTDIPIHVLIRPRFGDFCYNEYELNTMCEEVRMFLSEGAKGIAVGILKPDGMLNMEQMETIIKAAKGMSVTLHRAFDVCLDPFQALKSAKELGIHTILTSGQKGTCIAGWELLKELVEYGKDELEILVAGGINADVIKEIYPLIKARAYHMSGKMIIDSQMTYRRNEVNMGLFGLNEYEIWLTDENKVREAKRVLEEL